MCEAAFSRSCLQGAAWGLFCKMSVGDRARVRYYEQETDVFWFGLSRLSEGEGVSSSYLLTIAPWQQTSSSRPLRRRAPEVGERPSWLPPWPPAFMTVTVCIA
jgi:hypothetical protein